MRDAELLLGQRRIVQVIKLPAGEPPVKGVFLNANLEAIQVILVLGQERRHEAKGRQANGSITNKSTSGESLHAANVVTPA